MLALGVALLLGTGPGRDLVRGAVEGRIAGSVDGRVRLGGVRGSLLGSVRLESLRLELPDGSPVIDVRQAAARYSLRDLLRGRIVLREVRLTRPVVVLEQGADGRWNYERLFRLLEPDTAPPGSRPLVELHGATVEDGTLELALRPVPDSVARYEVTGVQLELARLRASHPESTAIVATIARLSGRLASPEFVLEDAAGAVVLDGDRLQFALASLRLPGTRAALAGELTLGATRSMDLALDAPSWSPADLRGFVPGLPSRGGGSASLRLRRFESGASELEVRDFTLASGRSSVRARGLASVSARGAVGFRDADVTVQPLDMSLVRPFAPSLGVSGLLRGRVRADGDRRDMRVSADVSFTDEAVAGAPTSHLLADGRLLNDGGATAFADLEIRRMDLELASLRRLAPAVTLDGRLGASGTLNGSMRQPVFSGELRQTAAPALVTVLRGDFGVAFGDTVALEIAVDARPLSFDLLARAYPAVPLRGSGAGTVSVSGPVNDLDIGLDLAGSWGRLAMEGSVVGDSSGLRIVAAGSSDTLDLGAHLETGPPTRLSGRWSADLHVSADSLMPVTGALSTSLHSSSVLGVPFAGTATVRLARDVMALDTLRVTVPGGALSAAGAIGRAGEAARELVLDARFEELQRIAPVLRWLGQRDGDTVGVSVAGPGSLSGRLVGTSADWGFEGSLDAERAEVAAVGVQRLRASGRLDLARGVLTTDLTVAADSFGAGGARYEPLEVGLRGSLDSLALRLSAGMAHGSSVRTVAAVYGDSTARTIRLETLELGLPAGTWALAAPAGITVTAADISVDRFVLADTRGKGRIEALGTLPRAAPGSFEVRAESLSVLDVFALAGRDTFGVGGTMDIVARMAGPADAPTMEMAVFVEEGRYADFRAPNTQVLGSYSARRLNLKGGLWRDGERMIAIGGVLPLDLSLAGVEQRLLPESLVITARADSLDFAALGPVTDVIRDLAGTTRIDVRVGGTWEDLAMGGHVELLRGALTIPALGVRYRDIDMRLDLDGNEIRVARGRLRSGGTLDVSGVVRMESLVRPVLDVTLRAQRFDAFQMREFAGVVGSGELTLRGPAIGATLAGQLTVDAGFLQFADLVQKRIVNLDDPEFRAIVDSNLARAFDLGPDIQTVLLDSLRISGLSVTLGPDVWMRSSEANIQLTGDFHVAKAIEDGLPRYRLDGTMRAVRGTYRLVLGTISRDFRVNRGSVRFFGTPDFDPEMDIAAEHTVRAVDGGQLMVRAVIGGTLFRPRLRLESDERPPLPETEIVSYLMFGRPTAGLVTGQEGRMGERALLQAALGSVTGLAASELGNVLIADLGLPLDYLTIRPGAGTATGALGGARIEAGTQMGERTFLTLNAGLCEVRTSQAVGASIEYRLAPRWTVEASLEPLVSECRAAGGALSNISARYQLGFDLHWMLGIR